MRLTESRKPGGRRSIVAAFVIVGATLALSGMHGNSARVVVVLAGAAALVLLTRRRRAASLPGAILSTAADLVADNGELFPGQLSATESAIQWMPATYSKRKGKSLLVFDPSTCVVNLEKGPALADVTVRVITEAGDTHSFGCAFAYKRLKGMLERMDVS